MDHRNTVQFSVRADYALFSDILTRTGGEKFSYPIPTYEALKGILHSVYWKPTLIWYIDEVRVVNPIRTLRKGMRPIGYGGGNDLAYYTYLCDVCYQVKAHFEWNMNRPELAGDRNEHKHHNIARRMIERGGRRDIFLGTRECQGYVEPCVFGEGEGYYDPPKPDDKPGEMKWEHDHSGEMTYALMLHGITYADEAVCPEDKGKMTVRFWQPVMKDGIIKFIRPEECTIKRCIKEMPVKPFGSGNFSGAEEFGGGDDIELDQ